MTSSTLRERQTELTRGAILDAVMRLVAQGRLADFSVQAVADEAGVAHRTVYRHFPSREVLLEELGEWLDERFAEEVGHARPGYPAIAPEELAEVTAMGFRIFDEHADLVEAYVTLSTGARMALKGRLRRTEWFRELLADRTAHLSEEDASAVAAIIRALGSSVTWMVLRTYGGSSGPPLARAARWAIQTLIRDLRAGGGPGLDGHGVTRGESGEDDHAERDDDDREDGGGGSR